ncbi:Mu transposase C-terminal domain-containing protein [Fodinicurvata halophila]|uniref:Mu transposase C-terminal domain-containing protein n=1 Tax=Fodinicurvata halophila TaxID=1419723 RepID=A0ABV8ULW2_9PROT
MITYKIKKGECVKFRKKFLVFQETTSDGCYLFKTKDENINKFLTHKQMEEAYESGNLELDVKFDSDGFYDDSRKINLLDLSEEDKRTTFARLEYCEALKNANIPRSKTYLDLLIRKVARERGDRIERESSDGSSGFTAPSADTLNRWFKEYLDKGIYGLVPATDRRGNRTNKLLADYTKKVGPVYANQVMDELHSEVRTYCKPERPPIKAVRDALCAILLSHNDNLPEDQKLHYPSEPTVTRMLHKLNAREVAKARDGEQAASNKYDPVGVREAPTVPMRIVEADHTTLDVNVLSDDGHNLGRPTMTVLLCRATRMVVGYYIGFAPPGGEAVMCAMRSMVMPKKPILKRLEHLGEFDNAWNAYGKPQELVLDNGPEFHGGALKTACLQLGINLTHCAAGTPKHKGAVERFFGSQNGIIHQIPGTTFSNIQEKGRYDSAENACIYLEELRHLLTKYIVDIYNQTPHRGDGMNLRTPQCAWDEGVREHTVTILRDYSDMDCLLGGYEKRTLSRKGIELFGLRYPPNMRASEVLEENRGLHKPNTETPSMEVQVRYDPADISYVKFLVPGTKEYVTLKCSAPESYTKNLTREVHRQIMSAVRQKGLKTDNFENLIRAKAALMKMISTYSERTATKGLTRLKRMMGEGRDVANITCAEDLKTEHESSSEPTEVNPELTTESHSDSQETDKEFKFPFEEEDEDVYERFVVSKR